MTPRVFARRNERVTERVRRLEIPCDEDVIRRQMISRVEAETSKAMQLAGEGGASLCMTPPAAHAC